jgi:putative flippase GtrA
MLRDRVAAAWSAHDHPLVQLLRFGLVGATTLVLDFVTYRLLLEAGVPLDLAKGAGFLLGTAAAYLLNRTWTFRAAGGSGAVARFVGLYAATLVVNVLVNAFLVRALGEVAWRIEIAFLVAQAVSSTLNFVGMRQLVFTERGPAPTDQPTPRQ